MDEQSKVMFIIIVAIFAAVALLTTLFPHVDLFG